MGVSLTILVATKGREQRDMELVERTRRAYSGSQVDHLVVGSDIHVLQDKPYSFVVMSPDLFKKYNSSKEERPLRQAFPQIPGDGQGPVRMRFVRKRRGPSLPTLGY